MIVDLHMHTKYSDGGLTVNDIIDEAKKNGVDLISITDHNTYIVYEKRLLKEINYITGMEIDSKYKGKILHMILYNFNLNSKSLKKYYKDSRRYEIRHFRRMIKEIKNKSDINIDEKAIKRFIKKNNYFDRVRLNNLLVECGVCNDPRDAYYTYTKNIKGYKRKNISMKTLFRLEKKSQGIISLAHPLHYNLDIESIKKMILKLKQQYGLRVIEAINNRQNLDEEKELIEFCTKNDLFISAGSDTHYKIGSNDLKKVGTINNRKVEDSEVTFLSLI